LAPNPANVFTDLIFDLEFKTYLHYSLINSIGIEVFSTESVYLEAGRHIQQVDLKDLPKGVYFLRV